MRSHAFARVRTHVDTKVARIDVNMAYEIRMSQKMTCTSYVRSYTYAVLYMVRRIPYMAYNTPCVQRIFERIHAK
jgi:hypothetical protein